MINGYRNWVLVGTIMKMKMNKEIPRLSLGIFYHRPGAPLYTKYLKKSLDKSE